MRNYNLAGKYALITGGTHGIGLAIAKELSYHGCNIAFCSRSETNLESTKKYFDGKNVKYLSFKADVLSDDDCDNVMHGIDSEWGRLDILINNVGGGGRWGKENIEDTDYIVWKEVYQKNANAAILFTRKAIPLMRKNKWGRIINITSILGKEGGGRPWFNMAKAAEVAMMKTLSMTKYLVRDGITFNSVAPGGIYIPGAGFETELKENPEKFNKMLDEDYPLGRMGKPEEVAYVVSFLCSELSSLVNGSQIVVDGGQTKSY